MTRAREAQVLASMLAARPGGGIGLGARAHRKPRTAVMLAPETDRLLTAAARKAGVSRAEFVRRHLPLVLEQYRPQREPRSARLRRPPRRERGGQYERFAERRR